MSEPPANALCAKCLKPLRRAKAAKATRRAGLPRVLVADWRDRVRRERGVDASDARALDTSRQAFQRAVDALKRAHLVGVFGARAWLC